MEIETESTIVSPTTASSVCLALDTRYATRRHSFSFFRDASRAVRRRDRRGVTAPNFTNSIEETPKLRLTHTLDIRPLYNTPPQPVLILRHMKPLTTPILPIHAAHAVAAARHTTTHSRGSDGTFAPSERTVSKQTFRSLSLNAPTRTWGPCRRDARRRRRNEKASQQRRLLLKMPMSKTMRFRRRETARCV